MSQEAINRTARQRRKARTLGPDAHCWRCHYADLTALQWKRGRVWCYECARTQEGRTTAEAHHVVGRSNHPSTVGIPGNIHRTLSDAQEDWPKATRYNRESDPLRWIAALLRSLRDLAQWAGDRLESVALWIETLADLLLDAWGPTWWETKGIGPLWSVDVSQGGMS
jgi:hypothetical protein